MEINKLDKLAYKIVDIRAKNKCEICGSRHNLSHHHIYGRGLSVRWETDGIMLICTFNKNCEFNHEEAHKHKKEFQKMYGNKRLEKLKKVIVYDIDYKAIEKKLNNKLNNEGR